MASVRRLTAILAADVAGYSRLMGTDEEGTHERLKAHLQELVNPKIAEHRGRIVKNTGDGFLAEFPSVVNAVRCAVEIQRGMAERNAETPEDKRIAFRIGVNLGDVIAEAGDIFGDGVNVAARLEALAEPGGICVSRVVRDQVRDRLDLGFEDLGEQQVKNIARPVRVYRVSDIGGGHQIPSAPAMPTLPLPDKPSVAVLPFANMSHDPEQEFFADGIAEEPARPVRQLCFITSPGLGGNEGLQHASERDERRCPQAVYEHPPKRWRGRTERAALHKGKAVRQFLHRHGQGLPQVGSAGQGQPARIHRIV
jgi:class 3 adenylate cyclase